MNIKTKYNSLKDKLFNLFGFKDFRENQQDIVENLMDGKDVLVIMPTVAANHYVFNFQH